MKNYLIVGNGVAGTTAAENVRKQDKEGKITQAMSEKKDISQVKDQILSEGFDLSK